VDLSSPHHLFYIPELVWCMLFRSTKNSLEHLLFTLCLYVCYYCPSAMHEASPLQLKDNFALRPLKLILF
jgi:hypothetical protein